MSNPPSTVEKRSTWRIWHGINYMIGGTTFLVGSFVLFPFFTNEYFSVDVASGWLYTIGSLTFLLADLTQWTHYWNTKCSYLGFVVNFGVSAAGSYFYLIGSYCFIPSVNKADLGMTYFVVGSSLIVLSQTWKLYRSLYRADKTVKQCIEEDHSGYYVDLFAGMGGAMYLVGTIALQNAAIFANLAMVAVIFYCFGGTFFMLSGLYMQKRYFYEQGQQNKIKMQSTADSPQWWKSTHFSLFLLFGLLLLISSLGKFPYYTNTFKTQQYSNYLFLFAMSMLLVANLFELVYFLLAGGQILASSLSFSGSLLLLYGSYKIVAASKDDHVVYEWLACGAAFLCFSQLLRMAIIMKPLKTVTQCISDHKFNYQAEAFSAIASFLFLISNLILFSTGEGQFLITLGITFACFGAVFYLSSAIDLFRKYFGKNVKRGQFFFKSSPTSAELEAQTQISQMAGELPMSSDRQMMY